MKTTKKNFVVEEEVFKSNCTVLANCDFSEIKKFKGFEKFEQNGCCASLMSSKDDTGNKVFLLWINKFENTPNDLGILAHEVFHLVMELIQYKGIKPSDSSEECIAYLIDYYFREILKKLIEKPRLAKDKKKE